MELWQQSLIEKHRWFWLADFHSSFAPLGVIVYTRGVFESFGHLDIEVCLPITLDELPAVIELIDKVVSEIIAGQRYLPNTPYLGLLGNAVPLSFSAVVRDGKQHLRIIYPDVKGKVDDFPFNMQSTGLRDDSRLLPQYFETWNIHDVAEVAHFIFTLNQQLPRAYALEVPLESYEHVSGTGSAFSAAEILRLNRILDYCRSVCGDCYDLEKIVTAMQRVAAAMDETAWRRENPPPPSA